MCRENNCKGYTLEVPVFSTDSKKEPMTNSAAALYTYIDISKRILERSAHISPINVHLHREL